jgi:DNA-binding transcriptional MocR family regulator
LIEPVEVHFQWRPQSRDPNDEMVLEAAINGRADALVTYNVADFAGPAERFRISVLFIRVGAYERHLRRVRRRNAARRKALLDAIQTHLRDRVEVTGDGAGAHVVLWPKRHTAENSIVAQAASRSVGVYGIVRYFVTRPSRAGNSGRDSKAG